MSMSPEMASHGHSLKEFKAYREKMNEKILAKGNLQIKRFFNLDTQAYNDGALPSNVSSRRSPTQSSSRPSI